MKSVIILESFIGFTTTVFGQNIIKTLSQFEIKQNGKTLVGLKNTEGKIIIPAKYAGLIIEKDYVFAEDYNGDYTYIDSTAKIICKYGLFSDFSSGVSVVTKYANLKDKNENIGVHGLMNKSGKMVVPFGVYSSYQYKGFLNGYCVVTVGKTGEVGVTKYGLIDSLGTVILKPIFRLMHPPSEGMVAIQDADTKRWGYANLKGEIVIPTIYFWVSPSFKNGIADVDTEGVFKGRIKIDKTGKKLQ